MKPTLITEAATLPLPGKELSFLEQRRLKDRANFERIYWDWLAARADAADPRYDGDAKDADEAADRRNDREWEAARLLFITPAVLPFQAWQKIEAFEVYLQDDADAQWTDRRIVAFFGCIKADLVKFSIVLPEDL